MNKIVSKLMRQPAKPAQSAQSAKPLDRHLSKAHGSPVWRRGTLVLVA